MFDKRHQEEEPPLYFWRDRTGHEVDFVMDLGMKLVPVEAKFSETVTRDQFRNLFYYMGVAGPRADRGLLIYAGEKAFEREGIAVRLWFYL
ncbi:DUF4143 domain-containing protein [Thermosulfurimonas sp. F29]|uniref:DUF4143 domain-containing protein n=1 Tax=Thermosulfurimonas sp. F29 TaxID=2867247 RepID=UPI00351D24A5